MIILIHYGGQRRRNDNFNKICVLEGVGEGEFYGKVSQNAVFPGKFHDNNIWRFCEFCSQKFCCHQTPSSQQPLFRTPQNQPFKIGVWKNWFSLPSCRSSSVIFLFLGRENLREIWLGQFVGFFRHAKIKALNFRGKFRSIFRGKIRASTESFVPTSFCRRATLKTGGGRFSFCERLRTQANHVAGHSSILKK